MKDSELGPERSAHAPTIARERLNFTRHATRCAVALGLAAGCAGSAWATHFRDAWGVKAFDLTNFEAITYGYVYTQGPNIDLSTGDWERAENEHEGLGSSEAVAQGASAKDTVASFGQMSFHANTTGGTGLPFNAVSESQTRDVFTISGGTGTGNIVVRGHATVSAAVGGYGGFNPIGQLSSTGTLGRFDSGYSISIYGGEGMPLQVTSATCGGTYQSTCVPTVDGTNARVEWSMTVPFEYGGKVFLFSGLFGHASTANSLAATSVTDAALVIDSIELPAGAQLSASSGQLYFYSGSWHYTPATTTTPVDLGIVAGFPKKPVKTGDPLDVNYIVTNFGPGAATATLTVPSPGNGIAVLSVVPSTGCTVTATGAVCTFSQDSGTTRSFLVRYATGTESAVDRSVNLTGAVSSVEPDAVSLNNSVTYKATIGKNVSVKPPKK